MELAQKVGRKGIIPTGFVDLGPCQERTVRYDSRLLASGRCSEQWRQTETVRAREREREREGGGGRGDRDREMIQQTKALITVNRSHKMIKAQASGMMI